MDANQVTISKELADWLLEFMDKGGNTIPQGKTYYESFYELKDCINNAIEDAENDVWLQMKDDQERAAYFDSLEEQE